MLITGIAFEFECLSAFEAQKNHIFLIKTKKLAENANFCSLDKLVILTCELVRPDVMNSVKPKQQRCKH